MPRYMVQASYTAEAAAAFASKPQDRVAGFRALMGQLGAQLDSADFCLGDYDVVVTYTAPNEVTATALALRVIGTGHIKSYKTTRLLSSEEFIAAMEKASGTTYQAPMRG
jgi:uncharacterized protein with GYD domain